MSSFDLDAWRQSLELTEQWLFDWRARCNLSVREICGRSGLPEEEVRFRLRRLRDRLAAQAAPPQP